MRRESITLSERGEQRLKKLVRESDAAQPVRAMPGQPRYAQPVLARAVSDVAALASGSFRVQSETPDSLTDSGQTRTAYALSAISANDLVSLVWHASPRSGGFFAAIAPTASAGSGSTCDVCGLVELIEELHTLTEDQQAQADAVKASCGCSATTPCTACDGGEAAESYAIEIIGLPIGNPYPTSMSNTDWLTLRDWVMQRRTAVPSGDSGFCVVDFDFGETTIGGNVYRLGNWTGGTLYRIYLAPRFPRTSITPNPIVYQNGFNFGFVIQNYYDDSDNTDCLATRSFLSDTPNEPFQLPTQVQLTTIVEPA